MEDDHGFYIPGLSHVFAALEIGPTRLFKKVSNKKIIRENSFKIKIYKETNLLEQ